MTTRWTPQNMNVFMYYTVHFYPFDTFYKTGLKRGEFGQKYVAIN